MIFIKINTIYIDLGISNSTNVSYENMQVKFNIDETGNYTDGNSLKSEMRWGFAITVYKNVCLEEKLPNTAE